MSELLDMSRGYLFSVADRIKSKSVSNTWKITYCGCVQTNDSAARKKFCFVNILFAKCVLFSAAIYLFYNQKMHKFNFSEHFLWKPEGYTEEYKVYIVIASF